MRNYKIILIENTLFKWPNSCKFKYICNASSIKQWNDMKVLLDLKVDFIYRNPFLRMWSHLLIKSCLEVQFKWAKDCYMKRLLPMRSTRGKHKWKNAIFAANEIYIQVKIILMIIEDYQKGFSFNLLYEFGNGSKFSWRYYHLLFYLVLRNPC